MPDHQNTPQTKKNKKTDSVDPGAPNATPNPENQWPNQSAAGSACCGRRCCVGVGRFVLVAFVAAIVQVCLRIAQSTALDGLQCGPPDLRHLSDVPFQGMHVLTTNSHGICSSRESELTVRVHVDGALAAHQLPSVVRVPCESTTRSSAEILRAQVRSLAPAARAALHKQLRSSGNIAGEMLEWLSASVLEDTDDWTLSKYYTPYGTPIRNEDLMQAFRQCGTVYLFQGGTFMWPGISVGHSTIVPIKPQYWLGTAR